MTPPKIAIRPVAMNRGEAGNPEGDLETLLALAAAIWREYYPAIIAPEQIDHMLELMYSPEVIRRELARGVTWELATAAGPEGSEGTEAEGTEGTAGTGGETAVGYLSFSVDQREGAAVLHKLYLVPRLHGQGIGRQLLDHVIDAATRAGARIVRLQVNKRNTRAIRAYERAGFVTTDAIVSDIGGGFVMDDYVMTLDLREAPRLEVHRGVTGS